MNRLNLNRLTLSESITADEQQSIDAWNLLKVQLNGARVSYVSAPLRAALFVDAPNDGVKGLKYLRTRDVA